MNYFIFLIITPFIFGFFMLNKNNSYQPSKASVLVHEILAKTAKIIEKKYDIVTSGEGVSMPSGVVKELCLSFNTSNRLQKKELRKLLIDFSSELLYQINSNKEIQQFLVKSPFTIENVQIIIFNHDKNGDGLCDPEISVAEISQGILTFQTNDPENDFKYKNEYTETYEEALKALNE